MRLGLLPLPLAGEGGVGVPDPVEPRMTPLALKKTGRNGPVLAI
jgi:hypothetical protein